MSFKWKKYSILFVPILSLILASCATTSGTKGSMSATPAIERVEEAIEVITEMADIPEEGVPEAIMRKARAVAIIPRVIKAAYGIGGQYGKGILALRNEKGEWSNPAFITLKGGSIGWQIGVRSSDIVLVFKSSRSIEKITRGKFTLGVDAGVTAGPVGRSVEASTDMELKAEIYSYSRSRGLFAGVSIKGASLEIDHDANAAFYSSRDIRTSDILMNKEIEAPAIAETLKNILTKYVVR